MILIIIYLICALFLLGFLSIVHFIFPVPSWYINNLVLIQCGYFGSLGGILYCLRGVYLNKSVRKNWDKDWTVWYYLRPLTSLISGFISGILLKAGLLVLDASTQSEQTFFGFYAISFIAGYNVDNFLKKIESLAKTTWGIDPSNVSKKD